WKKCRATSKENLKFKVKQVGVTRARLDYIRKSNWFYKTVRQNYTLPTSKMINSLALKVYYLTFHFIKPC
ncbi:MAG TPA: hypothetical protein VFW11_00485, partial [Cyclobacteriaceae bacterium]|nr:hypothetical protein [Cyclobacteriaceae bacterium]